jgi:hypothetical protein
LSLQSLLNPLFDFDADGLPMVVVPRRCLPRLRAKGTGWSSVAETDPMVTVLGFDPDWRLPA